RKQISYTIITKNKQGMVTGLLGYVFKFGSCRKIREYCSLAPFFAIVENKMNLKLLTDYSFSGPNFNFEYVQIFVNDPIIFSYPQFLILSPLNCIVHLKIASKDM
ncbi:hypothetical protein L9F63_006564, partial [Diploptera punctata]